MAIVDRSQRTAVYVITRKETGENYIGVSTKPKTRWGRHKSYSRWDKPKWHLHRAMKKYGIEAFEFKILCYTKDFKTALMLEEFGIACGIGKAYNMTDGGEGAVGRVATEETKSKISKAKKGTKRSEESKRLQSLSQTGSKRSEETKRKQSLAAKGRPKSQQTKNRCSKSQKARFDKMRAAGKDAPSKGLKRSEETKALLSSIALSRPPASEETCRKISEKATNRPWSPTRRERFEAKKKEKQGTMPLKPPSKFSEKALANIAEGQRRRRQRERDSKDPK